MVSQTFEVPEEIRVGLACPGKPATMHPTDPAARVASATGGHIGVMREAWLEAEAARMRMRLIEGGGTGWELAEWRHEAIEHWVQVASLIEKIQHYISPIINDGRP
ncbi:MAG TPA: hypothetical protein VMS08_02295 [Candidatus Saccharimonadia bacterium]|nr:hypothetical protein [Candidatus Saccharimonadia bacterium]